MTQDRQKELGKFMASGFVATILDYSLLNFFTIVAGFPLLVANSLSAPVSSYVSYKLNKNVVFEDRMHSRRKTLVLYVAILAFGILIIQNTILHFASGWLSDSVAATIQPVFHIFGIDNISKETIANNFAKLFASIFSALWNYFMLRRFVFVTTDDKESD